MEWKSKARMEWNGMKWNEMASNQWEPNAQAKQREIKS